MNSKSRKCKRCGGSIPEHYGQGRPRIWCVTCKPIALAEYRKQYFRKWYVKKCRDEPEWRVMRSQQELDRPKKAKDTEK